MAKDSDKTKKMLSKKHEDASDSDSDSDYNHIEDITRENMHLPAKDINRMILDIFPLKSKEEKLKQLEKIKEFKKKEKKNKMKDKEKKGKKGKKGKRNPSLSESKTSKLRKSFEKLKKMKKPENKIISKSSKKKSKNKKKRQETDSEWEDEEELEEETEEETEEDDEYFPENEDEELDDDELDMLKENMKFNIIFTTGPGGASMLGPAGQFDDFEDGEFVYYDDDEYDDVDEYITSSDSECDDEDESENPKKTSNKKQSKKTKFEKGETVMVKMKEWDDFYKGEVIKVNRFKNNSTKKMEVTYDIQLENEKYEDVTDVPSTRMKKVNKETLEFEELISEMKEIAATKKKGKKAFEKKIDTMIKAAEKKKEKDEKKENKKKKKKNMSKFKSLLKSKAPMNEFKYFNGLNIEQQKIVLKKMKELNEYDNVEKPYRLQLVESEIPVEYKSCAIKKIDSLTYMDPGSGEYYKVKQWVDTFMKIPFNIHRSLPIKMDDGTEKCKKFMLDAKNSLDGAVYGLDDAKMQIMQIVGQWISNPDSVGNAIAIQGPMGTGKTTLVKEGISKILNRPFAFLALGGATDSSFLEGHSYTYEGSSWGKIVDILLTSKCMNPVIYFDELDKISNTPKGEEIAGILTHLTDLTQNSQFHDKYFSNVDFDLSKALFIFSYNDESKVNKILLDRMYKIRTKGYDNKQKITIANDYLIPSIIKNVNFKKEDIVFPEETLEYIISNYTEGEKGVRNFKRALEIIYTKLNLYRLMDEDTSLFEGQKTFKVSFPHTVTVENVKSFIKKNDNVTQPPFGMYL